MTRRVTVLVLAALLTVFVMPARAAGPEGPQLALVTHDPRYGSELITIGPTGEMPQSLIVQPASDRPSWSADGSLLALGATGDDWDGSVVAVARADGSGLRAYRRAFLNGGDPVMAPNGRLIAFSRVNLVKVLPGRENYLFKSAIWLLDLEDGSVRRLTRWRLAAYLNPSSFSPDGSTLAAELADPRGNRAVAVDLHSRRLSPLARDASEPTYSPDGTKLAFVRLKARYFDLPKPNRPVSELWVASTDGGGAKRILRRKGFISFPSWDPSGNRLAFTRNPPAEATGELEPEPGNEVMAINADGTCLTRVFTDPQLTLYGSAWQPGPGRGAGPISC